MMKRSKVPRQLAAAGAVFGLAAAGLAVSAPSSAAPAEDSNGRDYRVLVFTGSEGGAHPATADGVNAIKDLGKEYRFAVQVTADPAKFDEEHLKQYRTVVFLNTEGDVLSDDQQASFEAYYAAGGGFVGIGSAVEFEPGWEFYTELIGTRAESLTDVQDGTIKVADRVHDASKDLPEYWTRTDAWYNFEDNVRGRSHVLATVVELVDELGAFEIQPSGEQLSGITGGTMGYDHPVAWCKDWQGGRSFYSGVGNTAASFGEPEFLTYLGGAITWSAGFSDPVYSDCGATVLANYQQTKVAAPPNIAEPIGFDVLPDGRVIQTQRSGGVALHDPETNTTTTLAEIPVYSHREDGMYGPAIDNNFAENNWVYLYYSPPTVEDVKLSTGEVVTQTTPDGNAPNTAESLEAWDPFVGYFQLSRFTFVDATESEPAHLDLESEQQILRVPNNRGACCHVAGDIDFDVDNHLWMVTADDTPAGGGGSGGFGPFNDQITASGLFTAPHNDARRSALNTNDLRGKLLRITVDDGDIAEEDENTFGGAYTVPDGNLFEVGAEKTRPEIYAMGMRNPFRLQVDSEGVAYIADYSPDSRVPEVNRGPQGTGRILVVDEPANYGWPLCYKTDLAYYQWDFNNQQPLHDPAQKFECDNPDHGPANESRWNVDGGPGVEPGLTETPPITNPEIWYSYNDNSANNPLGTPCEASYDGTVPAEDRVCPRLFPELETGGVGPHSATVYEYDADNPDETKLPPYYDGAVIFGEFTRDYLKAVRFDSQGEVFKINDFLNCGGVGTSDAEEFGFECDSPMDFQFDEDGHFYLLSYGDGFFRSNPDAGLYRWDYVKGQRAPNAVLSADPTNGQAPLTVQFSSEGSFDPDPGDSIRFEWDFDGNGTVDSTEPDPSHTYTVNGVYTARLTVHDSSGDSAAANTTITVGNTAPAVTLETPVEGGLFNFGESIPFSVTVVDPEDGVIDCDRVEVTFVLAHDDHGHAGDTTTGCSGVLTTDADDVSHGGDVGGVISVSYTDLGGPGGIPALTTVEQADVRQKLQQVEFALDQSGTNVQTTNDPDGGGEHRSSLSNGDWLALNGDLNLANIDDVTFRVASNNSDVPVEDPLVAVEVRLGAPDGELLTEATLTSTGGNDAWESQTVAITDPGGANRLYLVVRAIAGGATGNNLVRLNWVEFGGQGVSGP